MILRALHQRDAVSAWQLLLIVVTFVMNLQTSASSSPAREQPRRSDKSTRRAERVQPRAMAPALRDLRMPIMNKGDRAVGAVERRARLELGQVRRGRGGLGSDSGRSGRGGGAGRSRCGELSARPRRRPPWRRRTRPGGRAQPHAFLRAGAVEHVAWRQTYAAERAVGFTYDGASLYHLISRKLNAGELDQLPCKLHHDRPGPVPPRAAGDLVHELDATRPRRSAARSSAVSAATGRGSDSPALAFRAVPRRSAAVARLALRDRRVALRCPVHRGGRFAGPGARAWQPRRSRYAPRLELTNTTAVARAACVSGARFRARRNRRCGTRRCRTPDLGFSRERSSTAVVPLALVERVRQSADRERAQHGGAG